MIDVSEVIRNFGLLAAAFVGVFLGWQRVHAANIQAEAQIRQAELARRDHVAELFNRAVGQLTNEKLEIRMGAIFTLDQVTRDFPDLGGHIATLLSVYLRTQKDYGEDEPPEDITEIIKVLKSLGRLDNK